MRVCTTQPGLELWLEPDPTVTQAACTAWALARQTDRQTDSRRLAIADQPVCGTRTWPTAQLTTHCELPQPRQLPVPPALLCPALPSPALYSPVLVLCPALFSK